MQEQHTHSTGQGASPIATIDAIEALDRLQQIAAHLHVLWMASACLEDENNQDAVGQVCHDALKRCKKAMAALTYTGSAEDMDSNDGQIRECSLRLQRLLEKRHGGSFVETSIARRDDDSLTVYMFEVRDPLSFKA